MTAQKDSGDLCSGRDVNFEDTGGDILIMWAFHGRITCGILTKKKTFDLVFVFKIWFLFS